MPFLARFNQYEPVVTSLSQTCGHFPLVTETENNKKKSIPPSSSPRFLRGSPVGSPYPLNHTNTLMNVYDGPRGHRGIDKIKRIVFFHIMFKSGVVK